MNVFTIQNAYYKQRILTLDLNNYVYAVLTMAYGLNRSNEG